MLDNYFTIRMSREMINLIDAYRRRQPDLCSRAEAIRTLVWQGLISARTDKIPEDKENVE